jgi:hypothetical protein
MNSNASASNASFSIYIPRIKSSITTEYIQYIFDAENIGNVVRTDFCAIGQQIGFQELPIAGNPFKTAFVYIELFDTVQAQTFTNNVFDNNGFRFYSNKMEGYWITLHNKNPIPFTLMNHAQIVANCRHNELKNAELFDQQTATISALNATLQCVSQIVKEQHAHIISLGTNVSDLFGVVEKLRRFHNVRKELVQEQTAKYDNYKTTIDAHSSCIANIQQIITPKPIYTHSSVVQKLESQFDEVYTNSAGQALLRFIAEKDAKPIIQDTPTFTTDTNTLITDTLTTDTNTLTTDTNTLTTNTLTTPTKQKQFPSPPAYRAKCPHTPTKPLINLTSFEHDNECINEFVDEFLHYMPTTPCILDSNCEDESV